ncbi:MAG: M50 family metallopeptidase [Simkaniaceae bacterium]|nr:M50 family metallopeptidase [Candidatus Sacchlamyda saccharinae]
MIHIKGKIPITIHPLFWITAAILGFLWTQAIVGTAIVAVVVLVSVLVHEMGHATTALLFGLKPRIELVALGGLTYHQGDKLPFWKQFIIVLNGPLFGFCLFLIALFLMKVPAFSQGVPALFVRYFMLINLIWTIFNLVPVMPLDGGQMLRIALEGFFGAKGFRIALIIGMIIAGAASLFFFLTRNFLPGAILFLFAFQNFDMYRKLKNLSDKDRSGPLKQALEEAERDLQAGNKDKALFAFEKIRNESKEGMIHMMATQYIAFLKYDLGRTKEAYELLLPIRSELSPEALLLLHKAAYDEKNFPLVEEIGGSCFQVMPSKEVALRNALASAALARSKPAVGWLETAFQEGLDNLSDIIKSPEFDPIREDEIFQKFSQNHPE